MTYVGCAALPARMNREGYFAQLDFLECSLWYERAVKAATWKRWIDESPEDGLGVIAPKEITTMRGPGATADKIAAFAGALGTVSVVVFATPTAFSPSAANRDQLTRFFAELATTEALGGATRVWRPSGLWDVTTAAKAATDAGVVLSWDPLGDPTTPPETYEALPVASIYWRPTGLGRSGPLSPDHLDRLAGLCEPYEQSWVVLATAEAWKDSRRLRDLVQK